MATFFMKTRFSLQQLCISRECFKLDLNLTKFLIHEVNFLPLLVGKFYFYLFIKYGTIVPGYHPNTLTSEEEKKKQNKRVLICKGIAKKKFL